jgi:hypothetical protein
MENNMTEQFHLYFMDTSVFFTDEEFTCFNEMMDIKRAKKEETDKEEIKELNKELRDKKSIFDNLLSNHTSIRELRTDAIYGKNGEIRSSNVITMFSSILSRLIGINTDSVLPTDEIMIIRNYYYDIMDNLLDDGFMWQGEQYIYLSSGSSQIKTKKSVYIKKKTYERIEKALTCDLSWEDINKYEDKDGNHGVNPNKYNSYLSLSASASVEWKMPINSVLIVPDYSTKVTDIFDYFDKEKGYELIHGKDAGARTVSIDSFDGFGIVTPDKAVDDIFMFRAPWCKGLLAKVPFMDYFRKHKDKNGCVWIEDAWGNLHDIIKENPKIIMTDSQFKMRKYYDSQDDFIKKYNDSGCQAGITNINDVRKGINLNYQFLQTLDFYHDEKHDNLDLLVNPLKDKIRKINHGDKETLLRVLGATEGNEKKDEYRKSIELYPNLLRDSYSKELIKDAKDAMIKDAKGGKFKIDGYHNVYILPDVVNFMSRLIGRDEHAIHKNKVSCSLFHDGQKLDILRSPHLYVEHAVQTNVDVDEEYKKYFCTNGLYISNKSSISLLIMCDWDGDHVSITCNRLLTYAAKEKIKKENIYPLYYEMYDSKPLPLTMNNIGNNLKEAYKQNIGIWSNNISKIYNSNDPDMDSIRYLTMYNNFVIDYSKTIQLPKLPTDRAEKIAGYINNKVKLPHFFIYAKNKSGDQVEDKNDSTVNRLENIMTDKEDTPKEDRLDRRIFFRNNSVPMINYQMMVSNNRKLDKGDAQEIIDKYDEEVKRKKKNFPDEEKEEEYHEKKTRKFVCEMIKKKLAEINKDEIYVADVLVKYLYGNEKNRSKKTLWEMYGDTIVSNLERKLKNYHQCEKCGKLVKRKQGKDTHLCNQCKKN